MTYQKELNTMRRRLALVDMFQQGCRTLTAIFVILGFGAGGLAVIESSWDNPYGSLFSNIGIASAACAVAFGLGVVAIEFYYHYLKAAAPTQLRHLFW